MSHTHMGYNRVGRKCHGIRGFKLKLPRKFSVQRLRTRFLYFFRLLTRWRSCYRRVLKCLKRNLARNKSAAPAAGRGEYFSNRSSRSLMIMKEVPYRYGGINDHYRLKSFGRSNSFYSEAIADCLDFIKRNSLSMEEKPVLDQI